VCHRLLKNVRLCNTTIVPVSLQQGCTASEAPLVTCTWCGQQFLYWAVLTTHSLTVLTNHMTYMALTAVDLCVSATTCPGCMQAPSGSPSDVSSRLLDMCDVVDACEGLNVEAVVAAAERELQPSGSAGKHGLLGLEC